MSVINGSIIYNGKIMSVKDFLNNEIRIGIERYDLEDGVRVLTETHYESRPVDAALYLMEKIEEYKDKPLKRRPKFEMVYADKYSNKI